MFPAPAPMSERGEQDALRLQSRQVRCVPKQDGAEKRILFVRCCAKLEKRCCQPKVKGCTIEKRCNRNIKGRESCSRSVNQIPKNQLCVVHFPHNGNEYPFRTHARSTKNADGSYDVYWNCAKKHYRRLIRISSGAYIDKNWKYHEITDDKLCVWTEWESLTHASDMPSSTNSLGATSIQQPKYPVSVAVAAKNPRKYYGDGRASDAQNTDPCIFGKTFKYAICRQGHDPWLRKLAEKSLVLFWSHNGDSFCVDTVFVVGRNPIDYITGTTSNIKCSQEYRNLTFDRLDSGSEATFYRGISYDRNNPPQIYSFSPTTLLGGSKYARRCEFDATDIAQLNKIIDGEDAFIKINGHFRSKHVCVSSDKINCVWDKLARLATGKGFVLGVRFDWPKAKNENA